MIGIVMPLTDDESLLNEPIERNVKIALEPAIQAQHLVGRDTIELEDPHHLFFSVRHSRLSRCHCLIRERGLAMAHRKATCFVASVL